MSKKRKGWRRLEPGEMIASTDVFCLNSVNTKWQLVSQSLPHAVGRRVPAENPIFHEVYNRYEGAETYGELREATREKLARPFAY